MQEDDKKFGVMKWISSKTTKKPKVTPIAVVPRRRARNIEQVDQNALVVYQEVSANGDFTKALAGVGQALRKSTKEGGFDRGGLEGLGKMKKILETIDRFPKVEYGSPEYEKLEQSLQQQLLQWKESDQDKKKERRETDPTSLKKRQLCDSLLLQLECQRVIKGGEGNREMILQLSRSAAAQLDLLSGSATPPEGKGESDSFFIRNNEGQRKFIFKPIQGEAVQPGWPKGGGVAREVVLGRFNELMQREYGINFGVPKTTVTSLTSPDFVLGHSSHDVERQGALQDVIECEGDPEAYFRTCLESPRDTRTRQRIRDWKASFNDESIQEIALLDFITLNVDRNPGNLLVGKLGEDESKRKIFPIDGGNLLPPPDVFEQRSGAMFSPPRPGGDLIMAGNTLAQLPQAKKPFSSEMLQKIVALNPATISRGLASAQTDLPPELQGKISEETLTMVEMSVRFLQGMTAVKPRISLSTVSYMYSKFFNTFRQGVQDPETFFRDAIQVAEKEALELEKGALVAYLGGPGELAKRGFANIDALSMDQQIEILQRDKIDEVLEGLRKLLPLINRNQRKCEKARQMFEEKSDYYSQLERESSVPPNDENEKTERLKLLEQEDLDISRIMKKFGPWNSGVISPWKLLQATIDNNNLLVNEKVKLLNRRVNLEYDAYVQQLQIAQDLGQDHLDLLTRLRKRAAGQLLTEDSLMNDLDHLREQMATGAFATLVMIEKQQKELMRIDQELRAAYREYEMYSQSDWDVVWDWDTKVRQSFEIVKANARATLRGQNHLRDFVSLARGSQRVVSLAGEIREGINSALRIAEELGTLVEQILKGIDELTRRMPEREVSGGIEIEEEIVDNFENELDEEFDEEFKEKEN